MCYVVAEQNPFIGVSHMNATCWRWGKDFLPLPCIRACILETYRYSRLSSTSCWRLHRPVTGSSFFPPTLWPRNILWKKPRPISLKCKHPQSHYLNCGIKRRRLPCPTGSAGGEGPNSGAQRRFVFPLDKPKRQTERRLNGQVKLGQTPWDKWYYQIFLLEDYYLP